jgi:hypothetical protein
MRRFSENISRQTFAGDDNTSRGPHHSLKGAHMADDFILQTSGLTKEFKGFFAVSGGDLSIRRGMPWCSWQASS